MQKRHTHTKALSRFTQILDSSFPNGAFTHSFGLEPFVLEGIIKDKNSLFSFLKNVISYQYEKFEFPIITKVYEYCESGKLNLIVKLDKKIQAMQMYEFAKAYKNIGENIFFQLQNLELKKSITKSYFLHVKDRKTPANEMVILGIFAYESSLHVKDFMALFAKKNLMNIATSSLKVSRLKPSEVQEILFMIDDILDASVEKKYSKISNFNPFFEEIIFKHKHLEPKLFTT
ncbi:MAG: urease accessory protein UreF [Campylobacteraceae bacterium]